MTISQCLLTSHPLCIHTHTHTHTHKRTKLWNLEIKTWKEGTFHREVRTFIVPFVVKMLKQGWRTNRTRKNFLGTRHSLHSQFFLNWECSECLVPRTFFRVLLVRQPCFNILTTKGTMNVRTSLWNVSSFQVFISRFHSFVRLYCTTGDSNMYMCIGYLWNNIHREKPNYSVKNHSHCYSSHHKTQADWPGIETGPPRYEAGDKKCDSHGTVFEDGIWLELQIFKDAARTVQ